MLRKVICPVYVIERDKAGASESLSMAYIGWRRQPCLLWSHRIYGEERRAKLHSFCFFQRIETALRRLQDDYTIAIVNRDSIRSSISDERCFLRALPWLEMIIDTTRSVAELCRPSSCAINAMRRKNKQGGFSFSVVHDYDVYRTFMTTMCIPYAKSRFQQNAIAHQILSRRHAKDCPEIVQIYQHGRWVAGATITDCGDQTVMDLLGVLNGDHEYIRAGASAALYLAAMTVTHDRGQARLHLGGCSPILTGGITRYKAAARGTIIQPERMINRGFAFLALNDCYELRQFLAQNPFAFFDSDMTPGLSIFVESNALKDLPSLANNITRMRVKGMRQVHLLMPSSELDTDLTHTACRELAALIQLPVEAKEMKIMTPKN